MRLKAIKVGKFYETKLGVGKAIAVGGTHPPSIKMEFPRAGLRYCSPRDVLHETPEPVASAVEEPVNLAGIEDPEREERLTRRTKFIAEGCKTIADVTVAAAQFILDLTKLQRLGFELTEPVSDGYLHLEKEG